MMYPLKSLILYGIIEIILHLCFNVFHTLKHWFFMGLLRKNDAFGFSVFHDVIFLKSLTIYGIAGKMLHLVSMFSTILYPSNDWIAMGWLGKHCYQWCFLLWWIYWYEIVENFDIHSSSNKIYHWKCRKPIVYIYIYTDPTDRIVQLKTM